MLPDIKEELRAHGYALVLELMWRLCFTPEWRNGVLKRWPDSGFRAIYREKYIYTDIYETFKVKSRPGIVRILPDSFISSNLAHSAQYECASCYYKEETLFPIRRLSVYNHVRLSAKLLLLSPAIVNYNSPSPFGHRSVWILTSPIPMGQTGESQTDPNLLLAMVSDHAMMVTKR